MTSDHLCQLSYAVLRYYGGLAKHHQLQAVLFLFLGQRNAIRHFPSSTAVDKRWYTSGVMLL